MKVFMDTAVDFPKVKVIAIGAVDTARDVVECDPEMNTRISEISVPLLTTEELGEILTKGENLLKIRFGALKEQIASYASGLGAVCHQLALNICLAAGVTTTQQDEYWITNEHLTEALQAYMEDSSDSLKAAFAKALRRKRPRKFDNTGLILRALTIVGEQGALYADILRQIRLEEPNFPQGNLTLYLGELATSERGEMIRHDVVSGMYYYNDPLHFAYARCLFVAPRTAERVEMHILGQSFTVDLQEFLKLRAAAEDF